MSLCRHRIYWISVAVVVACVAIRGQSTPKTELINEFGLLPCGHIHAITDSFAEAMRMEPGSKAIILVYPPTHLPERADRRRKIISGFLQLRGLDQNRFSFYKAASSPDGEIRTQFWKVVEGTDISFKDAVLWVEEVPDVSRPFVFGYADEINICPTFVPRAFAKLILDNPGSIGRIVVEVGKDSVENRFAFAERYTDELVEMQRVPRKRLRLIFKKGKDGTSAEFWFVPNQKK